MANDPTDTVELLSKLKTGDIEARDQLVNRSVPPLRRWASGRLPQWARSLTDTQDLVQDVVLRVLPRLRSFEPQSPGALHAFLKRAVHNQVIDEIRKAQRHRPTDLVPDAHQDPAPSPLELAIKREGLEAYDAALQSLKPMDRAAIQLRVERQQSYAEIAVALSKPNPNAARMAVTRALGRLLEAVVKQRTARPSAS